MYKMKIAENIRRYRENCGYTQQQVANALKVDRSTYAYYELAKISPSIPAIYNLAKLFNIKYTDILNVEEETEPENLSDFVVGEGIPPRTVKADYIYELSKKEKQLILYFRNMDYLQQDDILEKSKEVSDTVQDEKDENKD